MHTTVLPFDDQSIRLASKLILEGEPVAVATETVYGLAADATNARAVAKIFEAKGRPSFNPLIVHCRDIGSAERIGLFDRAARMLGDRYWPGPLTLVVPLQEYAGIASIATAGLPTIALRVPAHPAMRALMEASGRPLAAPSANLSGSISPTRAQHVMKSLGGLIPLIIDAGATERGIESTIVRAENGSIRLLRPGPIDIEADSFDGGQIDAPGQLASHYAPTKTIRLNAIQGDDDEFLIGFGALEGDQNLSPTRDLIEAAANLFDLLHVADASDKLRIAVAPVPDEGIGRAINDRLRRAAHPR